MVGASWATGVVEWVGEAIGGYRGSGMVPGSHWWLTGHRRVESRVETVGGSWGQGEEGRRDMADNL